MLKVGLTGGIGSGKSFVSKVFASLGVPVYEADKKAKFLLENDLELIQSVKALLGEEAYLKERLNAGYISSLVFNDESLLQRYNKLIHPLVAKDFNHWSLMHQNDHYVLEEAALIFESGSYKMMDAVIFVKASEETQISRVIKRDRMSRNQVKERMNRQMDSDKKEALSDYVIVNETDSMILKKIVEIHEALKRQSES